MSRRRKPHLRCDECRMHRSLCICALLPRLETRTRVVLLLHQLEVGKPTNTGIVAARCLPNSAIVYRGRTPDADALETEARGASLDEQAAHLAAAIPPGTRAAFLFPHPSATPLAAWRDGAPVTLIVPDGTWRQAARARSRLGRALALPCVTLAGGAPASTPPGGRLRTATRPGQLATLEALALALGELEGQAVEDALMRVFRVMTDRTLWTNGRLPREAVTGGVPDGARSHDPLHLAPPRAARSERSAAAPRGASAGGAGPLGPELNDPRTRAAP
jgi:DTW domain-containing protein YfiP